MRADVTAQKKPWSEAATDMTSGTLWCGLITTIAWFAGSLLTPFFVMNTDLPYKAWEFAVFCVHTLSTIACGITYHPCPCVSYAILSHTLIFGTLFADTFATPRENAIVLFLVWMGSVATSAFVFYVAIRSLRKWWVVQRNEVALPPVGQPVQAHTVDGVFEDSMERM